MLFASEDILDLLSTPVWPELGSGEEPRAPVLAARCVDEGFADNVQLTCQKLEHSLVLQGSKTLIKARHRCCFRPFAAKHARHAHACLNGWTLALVQVQQ